METAELLETSEIWLKGFDALVRWFSRRTDAEVYRKSVIKNTFFFFTFFPSNHKKKFNHTWQQRNARKQKQTSFS